MTSEDIRAAVEKVGNVPTGEGSLTDLLDGDGDKWTLCRGWSQGAHSPILSQGGMKGPERPRGAAPPGPSQRLPAPWAAVTCDRRVIAQV